MVDRDYRWYILFVRTNHEFKVKNHIQRLGISSYLPVKKTLSYWSDRKKWIERPMFPGYLFVRVSCREFFSLLNYNSIICYVSFGNAPAFITDKQIDSIQRIETDNIKYIDECECYSCDDQIIIISGPLKGIEGRISRIDNNDYFVIDLPEITQSVHIRLKKKMITAS